MIRPIAIDFTGTRSTQLNRPYPISLNDPIGEVKSLKVVDNANFLTTFNFNGSVNPVLISDDIAKITLTLRDQNRRIIIRDLPASALQDQDGKGKYLTDNIRIDWSKSTATLQTAITGTPGFLIVYYEI